MAGQKSGINAGGSANKDVEPSSSPRSTLSSVNRGDEDGSTSSDENAGGDDDDTG